MNEQSLVNVGSASHLGENQVLRDSHFIYEYSRRRVQLPVISYMAVADAAGDQPTGQNAAKRALDILRDVIEPAVIAEEDLVSPHMERLIREALAQANTGLLGKDGAEGAPFPDVSLTMVIADPRRAYIGSIGTCRIYLMHNERLYDLTPAGGLSVAPPPGETMPLFGDGGATIDTPGAPEPAESVAGGPSILGRGPEVRVGYNEVEITPGDILVLCTDGLWRSVSEEELVENLLTAMNVQRSASQLTRLAYTRDATDNATMVAWQYLIPEQIEVVSPVKARKRERRSRAADVLLMALLVMVLVGIFAIGFAFGWKIADAFRKPAKEKARQAREADQKAEEEEKSSAPSSTPGSSAPESSTPGGSAPASTIIKTATVNGDGVRMRTSPDTNAGLVGLLRDGETVSVLGEVMGADSRAWSRVKGVVTSEGKSFEAEGFVRNDYLK
ncbi:MAG: protein phosphatase 2C domain-containing protein [Actinobacteria bacterium]|nr:protein phosphatase 2C domain-containing protein [Actinomycetota bacterium]MBU1942709.1 protein phosphatase 2C domain-containing protein [Actinomycetota bacterium]MBU2686031.1 protein phosphatase 2C domain-containing protein [Actinomycetota bacterium]